MASTFSNLGIILQASGENSGTWGDRTNVNLQRIDNAISGYSATVLAATTTSLAFSTNSDTTTYTEENGRSKVIEFTGTPGGTVTLTVPNIDKDYIAKNQTNQSITFTAGAGASTYTLESGYDAHIFVDGSDEVRNAYNKLKVNTLFASNIAVSGTTTFTLPTTDGTNGQAIITNGSGTLSFGSAGISTGKAIAMAIVFG
jgi:hypothetical protein